MDRKKDNNERYGSYPRSRADTSGYFLPPSFARPVFDDTAGIPRGRAKKRLERERQRRAAHVRRGRVLAARQDYALENTRFRSKLEAVRDRGDIGNDIFRLPEDKRVRKAKDYFFVMRKFCCFVMFLVLSAAVAFYALSYPKISVVPGKFSALFAETEPVVPQESEGTEGETTEGEGTEGEGAIAEGETGTPPESAPHNADGETESADGETESADGETEPAEDAAADTPESGGSFYGVWDPIFGFIDFVGSKLNVNVKTGDSPLYDDMLAKIEIGADNDYAAYFVYVFPVGLILWLLCAVIMAIKAFVAMFGKRICKGFGLGAVFMLLFGILTMLGGLAEATEVGAKINFASLKDIVMGPVSGRGGFAGGWGLWAVIALPLVVLVLSMFCRKKVPYAIFDTE